jgi:hypothetical protein
VPYYFTGHVQEDAFITFRCAVNLAESGVYGYNAGEKVSASTTHLYVLLTALIYKAVGEHFLPMLIFLNITLLVLGIYWLSGLLVEDWDQRMRLWILSSLTPIALLISYSGMETSLLIFTLGATVSLQLTPSTRRWAGPVMALLPWIRPDAVAFAGLLILFCTLRERKLPWGLIGGLVLGTAALAGFNYYYFGEVLNHTIIAKSVYYKIFNQWSLTQSFSQIFGIGGGWTGVFSPLTTKYLAPLSEVFLAGAMAAFSYDLYRNRSDYNRLTASGFFIAVAVLIPASYAVGGVIFPWYLWPASLFGAMLIIALALEVAGGKNHARTRAVSGLLFAVILVFSLGQLVLSCNQGMQESGYRRSVGLFIKDISSPADDILLEPAGYIPFYAERYTYDEVGLGSPTVTQYHIKYRQKWWSAFVRDRRPALLLVRCDLSTPSLYLESEEERTWFEDHYELVKVFHYRPEDWSQNPLLLPVLRMGSHSEYYLYRRTGR